MTALLRQIRSLNSVLVNWGSTLPTPIETAILQGLWIRSGPYPQKF